MCGIYLLILRDDAGQNLPEKLVQLPQVSGSLLEREKQGQHLCSAPVPAISGHN